MAREKLPDWPLVEPNPRPGRAHADNLTGSGKLRDSLETIFRGGVENRHACGPVGKAPRDEASGPARPPDAARRDRAKSGWGCTTRISHCWGIEPADPSS